MLFKNVIGQDEVKSHLINTVKNQRISHALLFHGRGCVGKLPLAMALAQYIHCEDPGEDDACGKCPSCKKHSHYAHPDMHYVFPVFNSDKRKKISDAYIEEWREMLSESAYFTLSQWLESIKGKDTKGKGEIYSDESLEITQKLSLKTYESEYKIMIIFNADKMNITAANKLLKILEEPTDKTLFILTAEDAGAMLPTILSRCQPVHIGPIDKNDLFEALMKNGEFDPADVTSAVNISGGCFCRALSYLNSTGENSEQFDSFVSIMRASYASKFEVMVEWSEKMDKLHIDEQKQMLHYFSSIIRNNYMKTIQAPSLAGMSSTENEFSEKFHPFINDKNIFYFREELEKALYHLERNGNAAIIFLDMAFSFSRFFKLAKN